MMSSRFALAASLAALFLAACGGSQPMGSAPSTAAAQTAMRSAKRSLNGYYLAKLTAVVGRSPASLLCLRFMSSGNWNSTGTVVDFYGTYDIAGKTLYASAAWFASPASYMTLQGPMNAKQGSGGFIVLNESGYISAGGTYTLAENQNSTCS